MGKTQYFTMSLWKYAQIYETFTCRVWEICGNFMDYISVIYECKLIIFL